MISRIRAFRMLSILTICFFSCMVGNAQTDHLFDIERVGNIHPYDDNIFLIRSSESGALTIQIHDSVCVYRTISEQIPAGETKIHWDGCG